MNHTLASFLFAMKGIRYKELKKWWAEGEKGFKVKKIDMLDFVPMLEAISELKSIPPQTQVEREVSVAICLLDNICYKPEIKYISWTKGERYGEIGYWEGEPPRSITVSATEELPFVEGGIL